MAIDAPAYTQITSAVEVVTPALAEQWLMHNPSNRSISASKVEKYAAAIKRGEWRLNGEPLIFDVIGNLMDGQHRLKAVVTSGMAVRMLVVKGVNPDARWTLDTGKARLAADVLTMHGEHNSASLAGGLRLLLRYKTDKFQSPGKDGLSNLQLVEFLQSHPRMRQAAAAAVGAGKTTINVFLSKSERTFLQYIFSEVDSADTMRFFDLFTSGENLNRTHPILLLRNRLLAEKSTGTYRLEQTVRLALIIKAWNAWRTGRSLVRLAWKHALEEFPEPI